MPTPRAGPSRCNARTLNAFLSKIPFGTLNRRRCPSGKASDMAIFCPFKKTVNGPRIPPKLSVTESRHKSFSCGVTISSGTRMKQRSQADEGNSPVVGTVTACQSAAPARLERTARMVAAMMRIIAIGAARCRKTMAP